MDDLQARELINKLDEYEKLKSRVERIDNILNFPKQIEEKYGHNDSLRINVEITHGNGSDKRGIFIQVDEINEFNNLLNFLKGYKKDTQEKITKL